MQIIVTSTGPTKNLDNLPQRMLEILHSLGKQDCDWFSYKNPIIQEYYMLQ